MTNTDQWPLQISADPESIPEKAKEGFSYREFGYIAAEQYFRSNSIWGYLMFGHMVLHDALDIAGTITLEYRLDHQDRVAFLAGWRAYLATIETPAVPGVVYERYGL